MWIFFIFGPIRFASAQLTSSHPFPLPGGTLSSGRRRHTAALCHAFFSLSQDELAASASSSDTALSRCLPSRVEIEALNSDHCHMLPSLNRLTFTLHCYKKIISTLVTRPTTQTHIHFASFLTRALRHRSSNHRHHSISPLSHVHHSFTQRQQ
jgi:hypothetical protein